MTSDAAASPVDLAAQRPYLLRFAMARLRDADLAQDAVQDTLLAALESKRAYAGKSAFRTWLTGILKHKIVDLKRRLAREPAPGDWGDDDWPQDGAAALAVSAHLPLPEAAWGDPERCLERVRFWQAFERGLGALSPNAERALTMRDVHGHETEDICRELGLSPGNCWVILHRGRRVKYKTIDQRPPKEGLLRKSVRKKGKPYIPPADHPWRHFTIAKRLPKRENPLPIESETQM